MAPGKKKAQQHIRNLADRDFQQAHDDGVVLKCQEFGAEMLYIGFKPSDRPSPEGGRRLCEGCPLLDACKTFAHNLPPGIADGVWGGQVWIDGVIQAD
jgi:hypothetical protein